VSHISKIELEIKDLENLKTTCKRLGLEFKQNQKTYQWYGEWMGDPLPDGVKEEDLGKCDHAIHIKKCKYEIGVVKKGGKYILLWDSYYQGGLERQLGKNAGKLKQAYAIEIVKKEAKRKGYRLHEKKVQQGIRLVLAA